MKFDKPKPMDKIEDEDGERVWPHMCDYDEFGLAPEITCIEMDTGNESTAINEELNGATRSMEQQQTTMGRSSSKMGSSWFACLED